MAMSNAMNPKSDFQTHSDGCRMNKISDVEQIFSRPGTPPQIVRGSNAQGENTKKVTCENLYTYSFALLEDTKTIFSQQIWAGTQDSVASAGNSGNLCDSTDEPVVLPKFEMNQTVDCWTPVENLSPEVLSLYCPKCDADKLGAKCHSGTVPNTKECTTLLDPSEMVKSNNFGAVVFFGIGIPLLLCAFCACFVACSMKPTIEFEWPCDKKTDTKMHNASNK